MYKFVQPKRLDREKLFSYLEDAIATNQFSNYGSAVKKLEVEARKRLKIIDDKAVIATSSGTSALHALLLAIEELTGKNHVASQAFTFPSAVQGVVKRSTIVDFDNNLEFDFNQTNNAEIAVVTNIFGHVQNIDRITQKAIHKNMIVIFDNAATPYSFWGELNACNYGIASFISLHHTKPLGFGEGGLIIVDREYEDIVRKAICFGKDSDKAFSSYASNFKMSELAAAGILQWWDQISFDELASEYKYRYFKEAEKMPKGIKLYPSSDNLETFFPSCLPIIHQQPILSKNPEIKKYYQPLAELPITANLYERILCYPITQ